MVSSSGTTTNPFGYRGALGYYANPETNDYYVRATTYEPTIARWKSPDPMLFENGDTNLYEYCKNNPVLLSDPSGMDYHHWFRQMGIPTIPRDLASRRGQMEVNRLCGRLVDIDRYTSFYHGRTAGGTINTPHVWLENVWNYPAQYELALRGSLTCCQLLTRVGALMVAAHQALAAEDARRLRNGGTGFLGGARITPYNFTLVRNRSGLNTTLEYIRLTALACIAQPSPVPVPVERPIPAPVIEPIRIPQVDPIRFGPIDMNDPRVVGAASSALIVLGAGMTIRYLGGGCGGGRMMWVP